MSYRQQAHMLTWAAMSALATQLSVQGLPQRMPSPPPAQAGYVVIDVLRATTSMVEACAHGVETIFPCSELPQARAIAKDRGALLAGERRGLPIEGFDLGNSPSQFTKERVDGRDLVMTTTNGTRALLACLPSAFLAVAAFSNREAVARRMLRRGGTYHLVCAGTDGYVAWEDVLLAGALVDRCCELDGSAGLVNDAARIARAAWWQAKADLALQLREGRGGQRVDEIGCGDDIAFAARLDVHSVIPVWNADYGGLRADRIEA